LSEYFNQFSDHIHKYRLLHHFQIYFDNKNHYHLNLNQVIFILPLFFKFPKTYQKFGNHFFYYYGLVFLIKKIRMGKKQVVLIKNFICTRMDALAKIMIFSERKYCFTLSYQVFPHFFLQFKSFSVKFIIIIIIFKI